MVDQTCLTQLWSTMVWLFTIEGAAPAEIECTLCIALLLYDHTIHLITTLWCCLTTYLSTPTTTPLTWTILSWGSVFSLHHTSSLLKIEVDLYRNWSCPMFIALYNITWSLGSLVIPAAGRSSSISHLGPRSRYSIESVTCYGVQKVERRWGRSRSLTFGEGRKALGTKVSSSSPRLAKIDRKAAWVRPH